MDTRDLKQQEGLTTTLGAMAVAPTSTQLVALKAWDH